MLPYKLCFNGIEDIDPAEQSPNPTRSSFGFVRPFCNELFAQFLETAHSFVRNFNYEVSVCVMVETLVKNERRGILRHLPK